MLHRRLLPARAELNRSARTMWCYRRLPDDVDMALLAGRVVYER